MRAAAWTNRVSAPRNARWPTRPTSRSWSTATPATALQRAEAYAEAGADAVLIHSKKSDADEVLAFAESWRGRLPVVIVPTMYHATPTEVFREAGISTVIWANHNLRAAITAMQDVSRHIVREQSITDVEHRIASVREIFELTGDVDLARDEARYLPARDAQCSAVLLAASRGHTLAGASMIDLLNHLIDTGIAVQVLYVAGDWMDVGDATDLLDAEQFA